MKSNLSVALNLLPGVGYLHRGEYLRGALDLTCFIIFIGIGRVLLSEGGVFLSLFVMVSSAYRMAYVVHVSAPIVQQAGRTAGGPKTLDPLGMITMLKPRWWVSVFNWPWLYILVAAMVVAYLSLETELSWTQIVMGAPFAMGLAKDFFSPDWSLLPNALGYAKQTIAIAVLGTFYGILIAVPMSVFCAKNLMSTSSTHSVYYVARWGMAVMRATPTFLLGLIFVAWVGLGPFPGVLAITVFSGALMTKLLSEAIESVNPGPIEAATATGANLFHVILFSVFPQLPTVFIAISLYCLEINIHSATVLGLIGAQGIGMPIHEYLSSLAYSSASVYILVVIFITVGTDYASGLVRSRIK